MFNRDWFRHSKLDRGENRHADSMVFFSKLKELNRISAPHIAPFRGGL
jgi:hypothetical protein